MIRGILLGVRKARVPTVLMSIGIVPVLVYAMFTLTILYGDYKEDLEIKAKEKANFIANYISSDIKNNAKTDFENEAYLSHLLLDDIVKISLTKSVSNKTYEYKSELDSDHDVESILMGLVNLTEDYYVSYHIFESGEVILSESPSEFGLPIASIRIEFCSAIWREMIATRLTEHVLTFISVLAAVIFGVSLITLGVEHHLKLLSDFIRKNDYRKNMNKEDLAVLKQSEQYQKTLANNRFYSDPSAGPMGIVEKSLVDMSAFSNALIVRQKDSIKEALAEHEEKSIQLENSQIIQAETHEILKSSNEELRATKVELEQTNDDLAEKNSELETKSRIASNAGKMMSSFVQNMSHEVRTPLNAINNFADLIPAAGTLNRAQIEYLGNVKKAGKALVEFFDEVLIFQKVESERYSSKPEKFDIVNEVESIIERESAKISRKGLDVYFIPDHKMPTYVLSDLVAFKLIIRNLVSNAIKFTEDGGVTIRSSRIGSTEDNELIQFEITDTGIGISKDDQEEIFQLFGLVDNSESKKYEGVGLGLALVTQLVKFLGGEIRVETEINEGSTFTVVIPMKKMGAVSPAQRNVIRMTYLDYSSNRVVVVDNDSNFIDSIASRLDYLGLESVQYLLNDDLATDELSDAVSLNSDVVIVRDYDRYIQSESNIVDLLNATKVLALETNVSDSHILNVLHNEPVFAAAPTYIRARKLFKYLCSAMGIEDKDSSFESSLETGSIPPLAGYRVLSADGDALSRNTTRETLVRLGAVVEDAESHEKALELVGLGSFDIAMIDLSMKSTTGEETASSVKEANLSCPIIGIGTSLVHEESPELTGVIERLLTKPLIQEELTSAVNDLRASGKIKAEV